jgi:hypothetical protein
VSIEPEAEGASHAQAIQYSWLKTVVFGIHTFQKVIVIKEVVSDLGNVM